MSDLHKAAEALIKHWEAGEFQNCTGYMAGHIGTLRQALDKPEIEPQALVEMAVLAEREACAKVCDEISEDYETRTDLNQTQKQVGQLAAEVCGVRIRGEK